jgi:hypothetical protein
MPDKFGHSDDTTIQQSATSVSTGIGVTMSQINITFLRRDGSNTIVGDLNMTKYKLTNLAKPTAENDAVSRKYVYNLIFATDTGLPQQYVSPRRQGAVVSIVYVGVVAAT